MFDYELYKRYVYLVYPDLMYFRRFKSNYPQDITSIAKNVSEGVQMWNTPLLYGTYHFSEDFEGNKKDILKFLEKKYSNFKLQHGSRNFPQEGVPLYVIKYPALYDNLLSHDDFVPLPFYEKFKETRMPDLLPDGSTPFNDFEGLIRTCPTLTYGVYSKDLGGFIENQAWSPIIDPHGYTFNQFPYDKLREIGEGEIITKHRQLRDKSEIEAFENSMGGEIYYHHKLAQIQDRYKELFKKDIPFFNLEPISEESIHRKFNENWDISSGLTPGDFRDEERFI